MMVIVLFMHQVCNNKGNCHCNSGYACPDCLEVGPDQGGSVDSGQGCQASKKGMIARCNKVSAVSKD